MRSWVLEWPWWNLFSFLILASISASVAATDSVMSEYFRPMGLWLFYGGITLALSGTAGIAQERSGLRHPARKLEKRIRRLLIAGGAVLFAAAFYLEK